MFTSSTVWDVDTPFSIRYNKPGSGYSSQSLYLCTQRSPASMQEFYQHWLWIQLTSCCILEHLDFGILPSKFLPCSETCSAPLSFSHRYPPQGLCIIQENLSQGGGGWVVVLLRTRPVSHRLVISSAQDLGQGEEMVPSWKNSRICWAGPEHTGTISRLRVPPAFVCFGILTEIALIFLIETHSHRPPHTHIHCNMQTMHMNTK